MKSGLLGLLYKSRQQRRLDSLWTEEEDRYLIRNLEKETYREIGEALGRSPNSVRHRKQRIGLPSQHGKPQQQQPSQYSQEQLNFLCANIGRMTYKQIAEVLGKSVSSISVKAHKMGITKNRTTDV